MKTSTSLFFKEVFNFSDIEPIERLAIFRLTFYLMLLITFPKFIEECIKTI